MWPRQDAAGSGSEAGRGAAAPRLLCSRTDLEVIVVAVKLCDGKGAQAAFSAS